MTICLWASMQRVEGVEELLLHAFLAAQELDVVDQQQVHRAVLLAELDQPLASARASMYSLVKVSQDR
jgi:hypothetical protein